jgi:parallel beta-helix repeat protein
MTLSSDAQKNSGSIENTKSMPVPWEGTMKKISILLSIAMLFTLGNASMGGSGAEVILNASQVVSAVDIEIAITMATDHGTRPGVVTLDSSAGDFTYTADDRSINIFYPNVTLRSRNGAGIANCADGIYFDDFVTDNIVVEGIRFTCDGGGVNAWGAGTHNDVIVRNNIFYTGGVSIEARGADGWIISGNQITSNETPIHLLETADARIAGNSLTAHANGIGIFLERSDSNIVSRNLVLNGWQGILLGWGASGNRVSENRIHLVRQSGISFEGENEYNNVLANKVSCQPDAECVIVNLDTPPFSWTNRILGNRLVR